MLLSRHILGLPSLKMFASLFPFPLTLYTNMALQRKFIFIGNKSILYPAVLIHFSPAIFFLLLIQVSLFQGNLAQQALSLHLNL